MIRSLCFLFTTLLVSVANSAERPNVLLIMADDLGFSDLGCYGGEIETPNLDDLAEHGVRFTQFYNTSRCWPTRASLLTGYYPHSVRRDKLPGIASGGAGQGKRPDWAPLVCRPLAAVGYRTYHTGKWHIDGMPIENGFDRSYHILDQSRFFSPTKHWKDDEPLPPVEPESGFYSTIALADHAVKCLSEHAAKYADQPFFHYLAFGAPHFPLHALPEDIDRYRERYKAGWDVTRQRRWQRLQELGIVKTSLSDVMPEVGPPYDYPDDLKQLGPDEVNRPMPWNELNQTQKDFQSTKMAIHAAMIDCMDRQIGRVLDQLRKMNAYDNTMVLFLSDNGASAEIMVRGDGHDPAAAMGSWKSHLCLGPGWSTVANTPFRYHKTWAHEGGIATPLIVHWPDRIKNTGELRRVPGHVIDVWPTIMEAVGIDEDHSPPRPGRSLLTDMSTEQMDQQPRTLWWLHEGNRSLRHGDWKISAVSGANMMADKKSGEAASGDWELYRVDVDRCETNDLANQHPEKVTELTLEWQRLLDDQSEMATRDEQVPSTNKKSARSKRRAGTTLAR